METAKALDIPLFRDLIPGGIEYGSVFLVEFEPQSCWYDVAYTMAAQAVRGGLKADLHIFQHNPKAVRDGVKRMGLDVKMLEDQDLLRFIDSYSVQIGVNTADVPKGADAFKTASVKLEDWARAAAQQMSTAIPETERNRLHIDDNTAVLTRYNREDDLIDYWRTKIIPLYKAREGVLMNAVALGVASDWFYKQHESLVDGIIDCRSTEESGVVQHYIRVRAYRGKAPDSRWRRVRIAGGEAFLEGAAGEGGLAIGASRQREEGERSLAAIMFTDMVGFTGIAQRNEALAMELLEEQRAVMRPLFAKYRGREVKTIGDAFLVEFSSASEAVKCAVGIQTALKEGNKRRPDDRKIVARVGVHLGDVIHVGTDVAGDAVNVASRIEPLALPGGICVTAQVHDSVVNKVECSFEPIGSPHLKNVSDPVIVYRVMGLGEAASQIETADYAKDRVAVLPLVNISQDPGDEYFSDGMTEELISSISKTRGLRVIARTSVMSFKGTSKPVRQIGKELGVSNVLEGSVRKVGNKVRISVQLVDASNEEPKWSQTYDRDLRDIFEVQSDISQKVAEALSVGLAGPTMQAESRTTANMDAYVNYLRGRQLWGSMNAEGLKASLEYFRKALELDARFASAYAGLADSYAWMAVLEFMPSREAFSNAKQAAERSLSIDPDLAEARASLALIRFQYDWDWPGAEIEFQEAVALKPGYALAHRFYSDYLKAMGRFDEALDQIRKAKELDPLSIDINSGYGHVLYLSHRVEEAIAQYRKTVDLDPSAPVPHIWFGRPYLEKGMFTEAVAELETAVKLTGGSTLSLAMLGHALGAAGRTDEAKGILAKLLERSKEKYVASYWIAQVFNGMRDKEDTLIWLNKAFGERSAWLVWANVEPRFDWLRDDPGFASIMKSMKFP